MPPVLAHLVQFGVAALGGFAFHRLGIPAAWLSGSMIAAVLWRASGQGRPLPKPLLDFAMLISGTAMGAGVTSESLAAVARYPLSLASLALGLVAISGASMLWLTRASGWRRDDAVLASVPGALSTVLIVAAERKADVGSIAIVQMFRLLVLMAVLPSIVVLAGGAQGEAWLGARQAIATPLGLAANLVGGLAAGALFRRIGIAAPILFGTAAVSAALHVTDLTPGVVPPAIATVSLVLIGMFIAENFRHLKWSAVRRLVPAALGSFVLGMAVASFFAAVGAALARVGFADALVAFAPGGLEAMMVLALVLGLDPLYVGVHHLVRLIVLGFSIPVVVGWLQRREPPPSRGGPTLDDR